MNQNDALLKLEQEFEGRNNKKYKVKSIVNNTVYDKEIRSQLLGFYLLVLWKNNPKEENIQESSATVMHLWKLISIFHKNHLKKLIVIYSLLDSILSMAKLIISKKLKQNPDYLNIKINKKGKK